MAFGGGTDTVFKVKDSGGTLTDISAYLNTSALNRTAGAYDVSTYGVGSKVYIPGLKDGRIPIGGPWDPTVDALLAGILALTRDFEWHPQGTSAGKVKYSGAAPYGVILVSYQPSSPVDGAVTFTGEFQITGPVTRGTN